MAFFQRCHLWLRQVLALSCFLTFRVPLLVHPSGWHQSCIGQRVFCELFLKFRFWYALFFLWAVSLFSPLGTCGQSGLRLFCDRCLFCDSMTLNDYLPLLWVIFVKQLAVDYTVELSLLLIAKWRNQDTLANQNSLETNMQSCTSTESPAAVQIDVRACSFIGEGERAYVYGRRRRAEVPKPGNFLSILSNISCG